MDSCRCLFVVSAERGELALATTFLRGQSIAAAARLLVPEALVGEVDASLSAATAPHGSFDDLLAAAEEHRPDLVFLCCGYLLVHEGLLSQSELARFVEEMQARGCRVVTTDPFLGLSRTTTFADTDLQWALPWKLGWMRELHGWLARKLGGTRRPLELPCIENVPHLYPTLIPDLGAEDAVERFSFFDPDTIRPDAAPGAASEEVSPTWIFVLSPFDYECQKMLIGRSRVARRIAFLLAAAQEAERVPVLVAPPDVIGIMEDLEGERELIPYCPYGELEPKLLAAEYAFYWSTFSFSMLVRVANEKPVFSFDRGRLARTVPRLFSAGQATHFGGWTPPRVDSKRLPLPKELEFLAGKQELALRVISERLRASPTPAGVVEGLTAPPASPEELASGSEASE
ncbi:MAG: hypothetical protein QF903_12695 [Planctomycetota bacterium]|jgi:hypothetical protein|nr:hypothetical protein [Planctomycetota bacterium]MDP6762292.1 hypothetical protein [Planctomycetota bacterium]MDP6990320.1 hypothetical protein [Planctomycetota bacterium]